MSANKKGKYYGKVGIRDEQDEQHGVLDVTALLEHQNSPSRPYESASWWSKLTFGWLSPILEIGNVNNRLDDKDLESIPLPDEDSSERVKAIFEQSWDEERAKAKEADRSPSLVRALWSAFYVEFCEAGLLKFVHDLLQFVGPQVLNGLILFVRDPNASMWEGLGLTGAVTVAQLLMSLCLRHYFFICYRVGLRIRSALILAIYQKALVVSGTRKSVGEITNLMSIDAQRLQDVVSFAHALWYSFLQIGLAIYFLWLQLGPSCLTGVAIIICSIPLTAISASWMGRLQKALMKAKDKRIEVNNEILSNMKIVKLQAWEKPFKEKLEGLREIELTRLLRYLIGRSVTFIMWSIVPLTISLGTFATYVLLGNRLDVASALTALALFEILRFPLFMLPNVINDLVEANVAVGRITSFLMSPEHEPVTAGGLTGIGGKIEDASFVYDSKKPASKEGDKLADAAWEFELLKAQLVDAETRLASMEGRENYGAVDSDGTANLLSLSRVNWAIQEGEFVAVVGSVGCSKSTFLKTLLGEVRRLSGTVNVKGKMAYFPQSPFVMNDSIKGNILFGKDNFEEDLYKTAISACALEHDLRLLPKGEDCLIGEKGITLSGGQRARIGMARVLYHDADINLLDDPLAAVDANVGRHLFEKCIVDSLLLDKHHSSSRKRTVILVTNALQYLTHPLVDKILVLHHGKVVESGTYTELAKKDGSRFSEFLKSFHKIRSSSSEHGPFDQEEAEDGPPDGPKQEDSLVGEGTTQQQSITNQKGKGKKLNGAVEEEDRETGKVDLKVYKAWAEAAGGLWVVGVILFVFSMAEGGRLFSNWWLTYWSAHGGEGGSSQLPFLGIYGLINTSSIFLDLSRSLVVLFCGLRASRKIFSRVLDAILRVKLAFFDVTPLGRIINRFSKDMYTVDEMLPGNFETYLWVLFEVVSTLLVVTFITPSFALSLIPMLYFYRIQQKYFTVSYRELKRLDSVRRSPIYALFGETLDGVSTIRAFSAQKSLSTRMSTMLDDQQHAFFLTKTGQCWLAVRLELLGTFIVFCACLAVVLEHGSEGGNEAFAGLAGLAISYALTVTQSLNWTVRVGSDFESNMIAIERLEQYVGLEPEAQMETLMDQQLPADWPKEGRVEFRNAKLRYRPSLPLVLKGLNISIPARRKVGVVGRTGAGKSTLMTALMRLVELEEGQVLIDGLDTRPIGLERLRSEIAVIPQDPVLFSGPIRSNLDPFGNFTDERLEGVLKKVCLFGQGPQSAINSLDDIILEGGSNFSVGQRQLLVIARSLLCASRIIICDEATAAVDGETDARIQAIFREEFAHATCLTVAHRLNTIMDSDLILVMDDGRAAEFDSPDALLSQETSIFKQLVQTWEEEHDSKGTVEV